MNEKELLNAMSEIKDDYIAEASENLEVKKVKKFSWKPWAAGLAAVLAICIGIGAIGNSFRVGSMASYDSVAEAETAYYDAGSAGYDYGSKSANAPAAPEEAANGSDEYAKDTSIDSAFVPAQKAETKLVYRATINVQTLEFDETEAALKNLVKELNGYFESTSLDNGGYYSDGSYKYGYYTVRIPQEKYDEFMQAVGENCHVSYISESVEDIGEQYFDVETRLETLNTQLDRLQELLAKASSLSDIIELESKISDTEYEINSYTSTLNRYDSLVGYATITLNIEQVYRVDDGVQQKNTFGARLWRNLKNGIFNFVDSIGDLLTWAAYNLIGIIIVVVAIVIIRKYHLLSRLWNWLFHRKKKQDE